MKSYFCFLLGMSFGVFITIQGANFYGSRVEAGTVIYPTEKECIIKAGGYCHYERLGIYAANKDED